MLSSLIASLHFLALGIGLGSVFMRGRYFKALAENPNSELDLKRLIIADNFWGVGALLWILTGAGRAFGGLEKGTEWYLHNPLFHLKMTLFILVFVLEMMPMVALIKARVRTGKGKPHGMTAEKLKLYRRLNHFEAMLVFIIIFVASAMARGLVPNFQ